MLYPVVRAVHRTYAYAVLWLYVGAFVLAFSLVFVFPPGTILLLFLAIFGLAFAVAGEKVLGLAENTLARGYMRAGTCPSCRERDTLGDATGLPDGAAKEILECSACGCLYMPWGCEVEREDLPRATNRSRTPAEPDDEPRANQH